jgi:hypothetical protein
VCGLAGSEGVLIGGRLGQGVGAAMYLGPHFPVDVAVGGLGLFIGSALNLVFGVPSASTVGASG